MKIKFSTTTQNSRPTTRLSHKWDDTIHHEEISSWEEFFNAVSRFANNRRHWSNAPKLSKEALLWELPKEAIKENLPSGEIQIQMAFNPQKPKLFNFGFREYPEAIEGVKIIIQFMPAGWSTYKLILGNEVDYM